MQNCTRKTKRYTAKTAKKTARKRTTTRKTTTPQWKAAAKKSWAKKPAQKKIAKSKSRWNMTAKSRTAKRTMSASAPRKTNKPRVWKAKPSRKVASTPRRMTTRRTIRRKKW